MLNRLRMFLNGKEYTGVLNVSVEPDNNNNLSNYIVRFNPSIPPITWNVNLYYL